MVEKIVPILGKAASSVNTLDAYVIHTKLTPPISRIGILDRPELFQKLGLSTPAPLTLCYAPAGYGKTTLIVSWLKYLPVKYAWYSLDEDDNESSRFLLYFIAAIQTQFHNFASSVVPNLITPQTTNIQHSITQLINNIARLNEDIVIVLDDYHRIENAEVQQIVKTLIDLCPPNLHLCIVTRTKPNLPLSQYRVRNQVVEINKDDIRFSSTDARMFFRTIMPLSNLNDTQIETLISKTEGWIAGMQLAAIGLRDQQKYDDLVEALSGRNRLIEDYFVDEILANTDDSTRRFLLFTSILSRFNASLCRAILPDVEASAMLDKLESLGYFILPLDYTREWYRYHHLFAEVLQRRLEEKYPNDVEALHRAASLWYESNGDYDEAFRHACAETSFGHAARLYEKYFWINVIKGRFSDSYRWLTIIPIAEFERSANLAALYAWCLFTAKGVYEEKWLVLAETLLDSGTDEKELKSDVIANVNMLRGFNACRVRDFRKSIEYVESIVKNASNANVARNNIALTVLGSNYHALGDLAAAESHYLRAIAHAIEHRIVPSFFPSIVGLSQLRLERGESRSAEQVIDIGFDAAKRFHWESLSNMAWLYLGQGEIEYQKYNFAKSLELFNEAYTLGQHQLRNMVRHYAALRMASIYLLRGDYGLADKFYNEATSEPYNFPLTPIISDFNALLLSVKIRRGEYLRSEEFSPDQINSGVSASNILHRQSWIAMAYGLVSLGRYEQANNMLVSMIGEFESRGLKEPMVRSFILLAIAKHGLGNTSSAFSQMVNAISIAGSSNIVVPFVEYREISGWFYEGASAARLAKEKIDIEFIESVFNRRDDDSVAVVEQVNNRAQMGALSVKEREALKWLAAGMSNPEISEKMHVSVNTVKTHLKNIYEKLGVNSRTAAIKWAVDAEILMTTKKQ